MKITKPKGTNDLYFDDIKIWQFIEENIRKIAEEYNINEIRTPVFEATELFARGVGDETDIVNKEMYTFEDKGGRSITLRPELTAGIVRAYIENGFSSMPSPLKFWYTGNMYRYEKMQKGRYREFSQFGLEIFGSASVFADIEAITISYELFKRLNLVDKVELSINSIGCCECRKNYIEKLKEYIKPRLANMCDTCKIRYEKNPMRIIDCKEEKCRKELENVPMITDYLCEECSKNFEQVKDILTKLNVPYIVDKGIVRGLDYYNRTVFEYTSKDLNLAVGGGGRYDKLVEILGGTSTPAVGFGIGMDRVVILLKENGIYDKLKKGIDIYFVVMDSSKYTVIKEIVDKLRMSGYSIDMDISEKSFKAQLKYADKLGARNVCIIGENEIKNNECTIKNMENGKQTTINFNQEEIEKMIKE